MTDDGTGKPVPPARHEKAKMTAVPLACCRLQWPWIGARCRQSGSLWHSHAEFVLRTPHSWSNP